MERLKLNLPFLFFLFNQVNCDQSICGLEPKERFGGTGKVRGNPTTIEQFPWSVSILRTDEDGNIQLHCSASLLTKKHILSAAHCFAPPYDDISQLLASFGSSKALEIDDENSIQSPLIELHIHPNYKDPEAYFDVAVLKTLRSIVFSENIFPICLPLEPKSSLDHLEDKRSTVVGFGNSKDELQSVRFDIYFKNICRDTHTTRNPFIKPKVDRNLPRMFEDPLFCAGDRQTSFGVCPGDSGGPLMRFDHNDKKYYQYGVVHGAVTECSNANYPAIFNRIDHPSILKFITDILDVFSRNDCTVVENQSGEDRPCSFPFKFNRRTYESCTREGDEDSRLWCSTKTHPTTFEHIKGHWGYCLSKCHQNIVEKNVTNTELGTYLPNESDGTCGKTSSNFSDKETLFVALLGYNSPNDDNRIDYNCRGTLINRRYVLTAASCLLGQAKVSQVLLGTFAKECLQPEYITACKKVQEFDVSDEDAIVHEGYDSSNFHIGDDIALIRLPRPVTTFNEDPSEPVMPVCIAWNTATPSSLHFVTDWKRENGLDLLENGDSYLFSNEACKTYPEFESISNEKQVCASMVNGTKKYCFGDGGGPLSAQELSGGAKYLVGILSFGVRDCKEGVPEVYTKVGYYKDWILKNMKP